MAAGRGEFFQSLSDGLQQPGPARGRLGPGRGGPGPGRGGPGPGRGGPGPGRGGPGRGGPGPGRGGPGRGGPGPGRGGPGPGRGGPGRGGPGPGRGGPGPGLGRGGPGPGLGRGGPGPGRGGPGPGRGGPGPGRGGPGRGGPGPGRGGPGPGRGGPGRGGPGPGRGGPGPGPGGPGPGRGRPGPGRGGPGPGRGGPGWRGRKRSVVSGRERRESKTKNTSPSHVNHLQRLPPEILMKILSYLDASSLFCISHVSRLFNHLANDDVMWQKIYMWEFGGQTWKPKAADAAAPEVGDRSAGRWKRMYFRTIAGQEVKRWRRELRDVSPYTGLPRQTQWVLRNVNVSWELTLCDRHGRTSTLQQSRAYFFESSVVVRWTGSCFPRYHNISSMQLYGVKKDPQSAGRAPQPGWRSLISTLDVTRQSARLIGKDRLITLVHLNPDFIIGIWRGERGVAFVMVSLHFHQLVEKSLLGSPVCPYAPPADRPRSDPSDPDFGLHGFSLHFVLHNTGAEIMSGHFRQLSCPRARIHRGLVQLSAISRTDPSQHRSLSGSIKLPWKSGELEGAVESCCIVTLTLLDDFQKPFWCLSSPICTTMARKKLSFDYSGEHFEMAHREREGEVKMMLVWLKEQKQFFLISLVVCLPVSKVNQHFSTEH